MQTKDSDKPNKKENVLMYVQFFRIGIIAFLVVLLAIFVFKGGQRYACSNGDGVLLENKCVGLVKVGTIKFCEDNILSGKEVCSEAIINQPNEFCQQYGSYIINGV